MMMKPTLLRIVTLALLTSPFTLRAQNDIDPKAREAAAAAAAARSVADTTGKLWTKSGVFNLNMTQVSLSNWAAGGYSSTSGIALFNGIANWKKGRKAWDNSLVLAFGGQVVQDAPYPVKTDDRIELNSKYGYEIAKAWYLAGVFQFKTQFTEGFDVDHVRISNLLAPAYITAGVGFDYKPNDHFNVFVSPAVARLIVVQDETLFGGSTDPDLRVYGVLNGDNTAFELGGYLRVQYQTEIAKNITFMTRGDVFSNYLRNPQNMDVNWETLWTFKVNDWFSATLNTLLIYDHDTNLSKTDVEGNTYTGPATQFKETLGIGLAWKIGAKPKE